MQLSKLIVEPRVRSAWASIDLGTALGRKFWWRGVGLYLTVAVPIFLLIQFSIGFNGWLPYLILWWLKPIFERPFLFSLSRELFSERCAYWQTIVSYRLWLWPSLLQILTIRRISTNRAMFAPVSLLEQPKGGDYARRASVLGFKFSGASTWLTVVLYHFENFIVFALLALLAFLFPDYIEASLVWFQDQSSNSVYTAFTFLLIMAIVAPIYCAAGFSLYICRRIELEGWDIEMCFRDWMQGYSRAHESQSPPSEPNRSIVDRMTGDQVSEARHD